MPGSRSSSRCRATLRARALPDRVRIGVDAAAPFRGLLVERLGTRVIVVPLDAADVIVRDGARATSSDAAGDLTTPVLVLVDDPHGERTRDALRDGASGVLARSAPPDDIVAAVAAIRACLVVLDGAARESFAPLASAPRSGAAADLTVREREVLAMLSAGASNRRIAERLAIAENTVKAHVASIFGKLGAATRTEAVTIALRRGLVML